MNLRPAAVLCACPPRSVPTGHFSRVASTALCISARRQLRTVAASRGSSVSLRVPSLAACRFPAPPVTRRAMWTAASFASSLAGQGALVIGATQSGEGADASATLLPLSALKPETLAKIEAALKASKFVAKRGDVRTLFAISDEVPVIAVAGLGKAESDPVKQREAARVAAAAGVSAVRALAPTTSTTVALAAFGDAQGLAEGAVLAQWSFDELKQAASRGAICPVTLVATDKAQEADWARGLALADAQNAARRLAETPANLMTPTIFAERVQTLFADVPKVTIHVRDPEWIASKGMGSFESVGRGSSQPQRLVEVHYAGNPAGWDAPKVGLVGKGVTFDSGGISIKPADGMAAMRADMMGAAEVMAATLAAAKLGLPINVITVAGLTENLINGQATKPGDVVKAMNGKTIEVDNTDAEGRLVLADCLYYVSTVYKPHTLLDMATLTGAMMISLGSVYTGFFSSSRNLTSALVSAGNAAGDKMWPMPLDTTYLGQMKSQTADLKNVGGRAGGACSAAAFLREFVDGLPKEEDGEGVEYAHIDIAGVMSAGEVDPSYLKKGQMTGRPVRAIIEFLSNIKK